MDWYASSKVGQKSSLTAAATLKKMGAIQVVSTMCAYLIRTYQRRRKVMAGVLGSTPEFWAAAMMAVAPGLGNVCSMSVSGQWRSGQ